MVDDHDDKRDDDEGRVPIRRQPKSLVAQKSLPTVESALDDFIIQAKQKTLDVSEFTPETREKQLRDEIAVLKQKLAAADMRSSVADPAPAARPSDGWGRWGRWGRWGMVVGAFVLGAASMFAFHVATRSDAPSRSATTHRAPTASTQSPQPASPPATVPATAATPLPAPSLPPPLPGSSTPSAGSGLAPATPIVSAKAAAPKPKQVRRPQGDSTTKPASPAPTGSGSGTDLYNPF